MIARFALGVSLLACSLTALADCSPLLDRSFRPLADKTPVNLCERFEGKVLLVVNTASKCGFTPQYEALEKLHADLAAQGFSVVGFPSNDFMGQSPAQRSRSRSSAR